MEFDKDKSHLSDLKKVEFESNTTSISSILEIHYSNFPDSF